MKKIIMIFFILSLLSLKTVRADEDIEVDPGLTPDKFFYFADIFLEDFSMMFKTDRGKITKTIEIIQERSYEIEYLIETGFDSKVTTTFTHLQNRIGYINEIIKESLIDGKDFDNLKIDLIDMLINITDDWNSYLTEGQITEAQNDIIETMILLNTEPEYIEKIFKYTANYSELEVIYLSNIYEYYGKPLDMYLKLDENNYINFDDFMNEYNIDKYFILNLAKNNQFNTKYYEFLDKHFLNGVILNYNDVDLMNIFKLYAFSDGKYSGESILNDNEVYYNFILQNDNMNSIIKTKLNLELKDTEYEMDEVSSNYINFYINSIKSGILISDMQYNIDYIRAKMIDNIDMQSSLEYLNFNTNESMLYYYSINDKVHNYLDGSELNSINEEIFIDYLTVLNQMYQDEDYFILSELIDGHIYDYIYDSIKILENPNLIFTDTSKNYNSAYISQLDPYIQNYYHAAIIFFNYMNFDEREELSEYYKEVRLDGLDYLKSAIYNDPNVNSIIRSNFLSYYNEAKLKIENNEQIDISNMTGYESIIELINQNMINSYAFVNLTKAPIFNNQNMYYFDIEVEYISKYINDNSLDENQILELQQYLYLKYHNEELFNDEYQDMIDHIDELIFASSNYFDNVNRYEDFSEFFNANTIDEKDYMIEIINDLGYNILANQMNLFYDYVFYDYVNFLEYDLKGIVTNDYIIGLHEINRDYSIVYDIVSHRNVDVSKTVFTSLELSQNSYFMDAIINRARNVEFNINPYENILIKYNYFNQWNYLMISKDINKYVLDEELELIYEAYNSLFYSILDDI